MLGSPDHRPLNCVLFCVLFSRFLNVNQPLQVGGVKETHPHRRTHPHYKGFVGCVKNLVVDSQVQTILFLSFFPTACTHTHQGCQAFFSQRWLGPSPMHSWEFTMWNHS